jgi:hypothetical protein
MIAFIVKSGICMVLLFGLYWLLLRKVKLFIFNRYYLIFSILFSLTVPFISFPIYIHNRTTSDILTFFNNPPELNTEQNEVDISNEKTVLSDSYVPPAQIEAVKNQTIDGERIFLFIYLSGFALMLIRFCRNILLVNKLLGRAEKIDHDWYKIALLNQPVNPFSFLRTVFINKQDYLENRIAPNVLSHELEHVRQSHSNDVIFFEMLHILFWFNPVLFLYKWAARINHEYLADEAVIRSISDMKTYANELINFISLRVSVPFTSGFSPSMIRLRLLMLNTNNTRWGKNMRMLITLFTAILLMSFVSIRPAYPDTQDRKNKKESINKDIVIEEVFFRGPDFKPLKALVVMNGKILGIDEMIAVDLQQIKTIDILKDRKAIRKYGRSAKNGVVEISTYESDRKSSPDSIKFKPFYTINDKGPDGRIKIPVSMLYSLNIWTYPIFPNQDPRKRWRIIGIMTRDFYKIKGKIIQKNGEPLPGVIVTANENPSTVRTDKEGRFLIADVDPGCKVSLASEGFEPLSFKVSDVVYKSDLTITLDRMNEPDTDENKESVGNSIRDFSGTWKFNKELSKTFLPDGMDYKFDIHQYDSDSIKMNSARTFKNKEFKSSRTHVFNKVKTTVRDTQKYVTSCSITPDEKSFSVTEHMSSILGLSRDYKRTETYSLNEDGKQLIISSYDFFEGSSNTRKGIQVLIFDRI